VAVKRTHYQAMAARTPHPHSEPMDAEISEIVSLLNRRKLQAFEQMACLVRMVGAEVAARNEALKLIEDGRTTEAASVLRNRTADRDANIAHALSLLGVFTG